VRGSYPTQWKLNGADYFLLAIDRQMQAQIPPGNICRLQFKVNGQLEQSVLTQRCQQSPFFRHLLSMRLRRRFFRIPIWKSIRKSEATLNSDNCNQLRSPKSAPLRINVVDFSDNFTTIEFSWHHALMDAHGAEQLLRFIGGDTDASRFVLWPPTADREPLLKRLTAARAAREYLVASIPKQFTRMPDPPKNVVSHWHRIEFTAAETAEIDEQAVAAGAGISRSLFYLTCISLAIDRLMLHRGVVPDSYLIPVPHDRRRKGRYGPIVANHVTFLFLHLNRESRTSVSTAVRELTQQLRGYMSNELGNTYATFMNLCSHLPLWLYGKMIRGPTQGAMATFFFSDTGHSFAKMNSFMELPLVDAIHLPPNTAPPGLTFVCSRFKDALKVSVARTDASIAADEFELFAGWLRELLMSGKSEQ